MIRARTNPSGRRNYQPSTCAGLLAGLVIVAGSVNAQESPSIQTAPMSRRIESVIPADPTSSMLDPLLGASDRGPDLFGEQRHDRLALPRIDWLELAGIGEASEPPPTRLSTLSLQQPADQHRAPTHTGFKALLFETGRDFNAFPRRRSTWVILAIGGAAAAIAHPADDKVNARLAGSQAASRFFAPGKYIGAVYTQAGAAIGLYAIGRYVLPHADGEPKTNKVSHLGFDLLRSLIVSQALTQGIKVAVRRDRPTGECCAFPSGHASATFATASVLERHFGYRGAWPTFVVAAYVATSRLHDNRHFLSDVLLGGALGIASGWTVVGRHGRSNYALVPVPVKGGVMVTLTRRRPTPSR